MRKYPDEELHQWILDVNQNHIDSGETADPSTCPIALALRERREQSKARTWNYRTFITNHAGYRKDYVHSKAIKEWIRAYDADKNVEPIQVLMDPIFYQMKLITESTEVEKEHHENT